MHRYRMSPFQRLARRTARALGHPQGFVIAVGAVVVWALTGPVFGYSDTWQLAINTATTVITFLMVFLIQNSQNHDSAVLQLKLDELIRTSAKAHNALLDLEELSEEEIDLLRQRYRTLAGTARKHLRRHEGDFGVPEVKVD